MSRPFLLAALGYLVPTFPLGYFWHLSVFADRYRQLAMYRDDVIIPFGLASMIIQALLFAWAYPRLLGQGRSWVRGAVEFGCFFGVLAWSLAVLPVAAKYRMSSVAEFMLLETAFTLLQYAVVSPLIALAYRGVRRSGSRVAVA
jgi:riboflavin transporter FmnP